MLSPFLVLLNEFFALASVSCSHIGAAFFEMIGDVLSLVCESLLSMPGSELYGAFPFTFRVLRVPGLASLKNSVPV
jgi:hypothetical protein